MPLYRLVDQPERDRREQDDHDEDQLQQPVHPERRPGPGRRSARRPRCPRPSRRRSRSGSPRRPGSCCRRRGRAGATRRSRRSSAAAPDRTKTARMIQRRCGISRSVPRDVVARASPLRCSPLQPPCGVAASTTREPRSRRVRTSRSGPPPQKTANPFTASLGFAITTPPTSSSSPRRLPASPPATARSQPGDGADGIWHRQQAVPDRVGADEDRVEPARQRSGASSDS